ncbi:GDSL-type esterase/lipase family protein [Adhaeretor mobilis]|nr:GDSL-type esterase/lipase family protein [Adhaeretor mobilis]
MQSENLKNRLLLGIGTFLCVLWISFPVRVDAAVIALAGDSTVASNNGWGDALSNFIPTTYTVNNQGINGRSTKSFINEGRWQNTLDLNSDYVFIQFGHNDQKLNNSSLGTYPDDNPTHVTPGPLDLYSGNLRSMVDDVVSSGATPILLTPVARRWTPYTSTQAQININNWLGATDGFGNQYSLLDYADAVKAVGIEKNVTVIDLNQLSLNLYIEMIGNGEDISTFGPPEDNTHFSAVGSLAIAGLVGESITMLWGDFDADGDTDGRDFLRWQIGEAPNPLSQSDLGNWEANYGWVAPSVEVAVVPEPTYLVLLLGILSLGGQFRPTR